MNIKRERCQNGFTLVELLVALAIFGLVMTAVLQVFRTNYRSYALQEDVAELQQNVRVSKMFLTRDVRMAGAGLTGLNYNGAPVYAIDFQNGIGGGGSDILTIRYKNFDSAGCGTPTGLAPVACDQLPQLLLSGTMPTNSTTADVTAPGVTDENDVFADSPYDLWDTSYNTHGCECGGVVYDKVFPFKVIITAPDGSMADILIITGVSATGSGNYDNLANGPNVTDADGVTWPNKVLNSYPAGSTINFFNEDMIEEVVYKIEDNVFKCSRKSDGGAFDPIAENIEDLQFSFGLDTSIPVDGVVDTWINNADLTNTQKGQVRLVRINILGQTSGIHQAVNSQTYDIEDHSSGAADDRRLRKLLTTTIKVRNLGM